jgi:hypothetical protein
MRGAIPPLPHASSWHRDNFTFIRPHDLYLRGGRRRRRRRRHFIINSETEDENKGRRHGVCF